MRADEAIASVAGLSPYGRQTLQTVITHFGMLPFRDEQLLRHVRQGYSGAECRLGLIELELAGLVKGFRKGWGDKAHLIPRHLFRSCWEAIFTKMQPNVVDESKVLVQLDSLEAILPLSERLMHGLAELVKCGLARTAKGSWPKRTVERVGRALELEEDKLAPFKMAVCEPGIPLLFALLLDYARCEGWLVPAERNDRLEIRRLNQWLNRTQTAREQGLVCFWIEEYAAVEPSLANAAAFVARWPAYEWCTPTCDGDDDERFTDAVVRWCEAAVSLGWMEAAATFGGQKVYRWLFDMNEIAEASYADGRTHASIAPDGDVFVPREDALSAAFGLELIARRVSSDVVGVYRLEAESLRKAVGLGFSDAHIHRFLTWISGEELPRTLCIAIDGWISEAMDAKRDSGHSALPFAHLLVELMQDEAADLPAGTSAARPFAIPHNIQEMVELRPSEPSALFQGLDGVPSSWRNQMRQYHPSTRRELLEHALSWRTAVKLSIRGKAVPFIPDKLIEDENGWRVSGDLQWDGQTEHKQLAPHMWDEMMLVIPEFTKY